jgi:hypothetical protein
MTVIKIELIDPRVKAILEDLAKMNLIRIQEAAEPREQLSALLSKLRSNEEEAPSIEEITREVEWVRSQRRESNG